MISGQDFIKMANIIFCPLQDNIYCNYNVDVVNDINNTDKPIIYCHISFIPQLFDLLKSVEKKVILISHNSDHNTPGIEIPNCIIKWYSQNVTINDSRVESLPIGIENDVWFPEIGKRNKIIEKLKETKTYVNLLYVNHDIHTNIKERKEPYDIFKNQWTTLKSYKNGQNFDEYINDIYRHKFVICPNGNGIDTHRLWETLYLKSIPIVKRSVNTLFYTDLPILFVNEWCEINEGYLLCQYDRIINTKWDLSKLDIEYWKNKINNTWI